jgi:hypothetical protein
MSDKEYENNGVLEMIVIGNLKNVKSSTQFFEGPIFLDARIADLASATLPKTPPALVVPNGALWST